MRHAQIGADGDAIEPVAASDARDAAALWLAQPTEAVTASRPHAAPKVTLALLIVASRA